MKNVVWFKRDLRLSDHAPLREAINNGRPTILLFVIEPELINSEHYSNRHWKFMLESIAEMQQKLLPYNAEISVLQGEIRSILQMLYEEHGAFRLFSHLEIGIHTTFVRDKAVRVWIKKQGLSWAEYPQNAITRGRRNRNGWNKDWERFMNSPLIHVPLSELAFQKTSNKLINSFNPSLALSEEDDSMQRGGRLNGEKLLRSFLSKRYTNYSKNISKPLTSRSYCSRLSPYLAWGVLSIREVTQSTALRMRELPRNRSLQNFMSRLHWHCHFIQKFESECDMEFKNQNPAYNIIRTTINDHYLEAWSTGQTGIPLIDACMRCVNTTGYLNFRMRAMLVSFWTHNLQQPWQPAADHLSKQFLDFEPGIHFPQIQMQAGTVGYHTLRIYNPIKQAEDHDPDAEFIKKWVPELARLPAIFAREPWKMTPIECIMEDFHLGQHYPEAICDVEASGRFATETIHRIKKSSESRRFAEQIRQTHVN